MSRERLTVGLTFFLHGAEQSVWSNGADQHSVFLWQLLRASPLVGRVYAINGGDAAGPARRLMLDGLGIEFVKPEAVADELDVLIELRAQVAAELVERVHRRGGKAVAFKCGNSFVIETERIIHHRPAGAIHNGTRFDAVWTNPQHVETCASYWRTCYRAPVIVLPHIWEPYFVDKAAAELPSGLTFGYQPGRTRKRVSVLEPNHNIVKTCIIPMLVCENAFRQVPERFASVMVTNTLQFKEHLTFKHFAANLDIVQAQGEDGLSLCSFEARYPAPWWLARHTDVVVAHQWQNGLNFAYYDSLHGGYPLVHNADLPDGIGYHYSGFDAEDGGRALVAALTTHDARADGYRADATAYLETVRATAPANIEAHTKALADLFTN